jgi:hypothetical protein
MKTTAHIHSPAAHNRQLSNSVLGEPGIGIDAFEKKEILCPWRERKQIRRLVNL